MEIFKDLVKDPSNSTRKRWGYFLKGKIGKKTGIHRISKKYFFDIKYGRFNPTTIGTETVNKQQ